jgi:hypothetical protein
MEYHLAIPTELLEARPLPQICLASGAREGVSYRSLLLRERVPILASIILLTMPLLWMGAAAGDTLRINVPLGRRASTSSRWGAAIDACAMVILFGLCIVSTFVLDGVVPRGAAALFGFGSGLVGWIGYRVWRRSTAPVALVDYDDRVTVLAVRRADVAAEIERYVAGLRVPDDLRRELRTSQARLHRARGTWSSLPEEAHRGALSTASVVGGKLSNLSESTGALACAPMERRSPGGS